MEGDNWPVPEAAAEAGREPALATDGAGLRGCAGLAGASGECVLSSLLPAYWQRLCRGGRKPTSCQRTYQSTYLPSHQSGKPLRTPFWPNLVPRIGLSEPFGSLTEPLRSAFAGVLGAEIRQVRLQEAEKPEVSRKRRLTAVTFGIQ
jgi:hypothetical protein